MWPTFFPGLASWATNCIAGFWKGDSWVKKNVLSYSRGMWILSSNFCLVASHAKVDRYVWPDILSATELLFSIHAIHGYPRILLTCLQCWHRRTNFRSFVILELLIRLIYTSIRIFRQERTPWPIAQGCRRSTTRKHLQRCSKNILISVHDKINTITKTLCTIDRFTDTNLNVFIFSCKIKMSFEHRLLCVVTRR